ncbi:uncharacterized protein LOC125853490 [Solanum stenotomum]|uniref:uncharacterized protein LOC125853490 n=1 Tax=Solanum stenotomum TaxID=172797 RepID=UPI0020D1082F|nr:uncharacterized protein LOC125853490 [Solanum stenotomum]
MVQQPPTWCEVCGGGDHNAEVCGVNPKSVHFVGKTHRGGNQQNYGNTYNPSWRNHPNFSWGGNQNQHQGQKQYMPQGSGQHYNQQSHGNQQATKQATQNLEKQFGQFASAQNSQPQGGLPGNIDPKPKQVNVVSTRSGRPLEELMSKIKAVEEKGKQVDEAGPSEQRVDEEPKAKPPPPFPQKFKKQKEDEYFDMVANKSRLAEYATVALTEECSSRIQNKLPAKLKDPRSFTVQIKIGKCIEARGLCDLGANINLMPTSMFLKLGLGRPKSTTIMLQLADRLVARPDDVVEDVLVQVGTLIFSMDFVILDFELDPEVPFILGRPFLGIGGALIDVAVGRLTMRAHDKVRVFDVYKAIKLPAIYEELSAITIIDEETTTKYVEARDPLEKVLIGKDIEGDTEA